MKKEFPKLNRQSVPDTSLDSAEKAAHAFIEKFPSPAGNEKIAMQEKETSNPIIDFDQFLVTESQLRNEPPPRKFLVQSILPMGAVCLLASPGGLGKSMLLLDLALKTATEWRGIDFSKNGDFFGHDIMKRGPVLFLTAEDCQEEMDIRLYSLGKNRPLPDFPLIVAPLLGIRGALPMIRPSPNGIEKTHSYYELVDYAKKLKPVLIIADPLSALTDCDMNRPELASPTIQAFVDLATETGACVLVTHHFHKPQKEISNVEEARKAIRGTTALVDRARAALVLWPVPSSKRGKEDQELVNGCLCKANFPGDKELKSFTRDENGLLTCIGKATLTPKYSQEDLETLETAIKLAAENGQPFSHTGQSGLFEQRAALPDPLKNFPKHVLEKLGTQLLQEGKIVKCIIGNAKTRKWLDVPTGPFAQGEGIIEPGAMEAKNVSKNWKTVPEKNRSQNALGTVLSSKTIGTQ